MIGTEAFRSCTSLTDIIMPNCSYLDSGVFANTNISTINLPNLLELTPHDILGSYSHIGTFANCSNLISINLPKCSFLNHNAFASCTALSSLTSTAFPLVTIIPYGAFKNCTNLSTINLPNCNTISTYAFTECTSL